MNYQQAMIHQVFSNIRNRALDRPAENAIKVYRNNYLETGINALGIGFPTLKSLLGNENFRQLTKAYLNNYPKTCFDWADYGQYLAEFMLEIESLAEQPFLPEIAALDWQLLHIEREADKTFDATSFSLMQTIPLDKLSFVSAPGLKIQKLRFPVVELYQLAHDLIPKEGAQRDKLIKNINKSINHAIKTSETRSIVMWREQYKALFEYCNKNEVKAYESIQAKQSIESVLSHFTDNQDAMTEWLQRSIQQKKIYAVQQISDNI